MANLRLNQLICGQTEDNTGPDEVYMRVNGSIVWGVVSMNNGQMQSLATVPLLPFFGLASVELFDQDVGGPFDPDDFLGAIPVSTNQAGLGVQVGSFTGDEANYTLVYEIFP